MVLKMCGYLSKNYQIKITKQENQRKDNQEIKIFRIPTIFKWLFNGFYNNNNYQQLLLEMS